MSNATKIIPVAIGALLYVISITAHAQQPGKVPRIGYVSGSGDPKTPGPLVEAFRQGLRDLNYIERNNILVEYRYVERGLDSVPDLLTELLRLKLDLLVTTFTVATRAAKQSIKTVPIVMVSPADPVATGIVDSLARHGGNITRVARLTRELSGNGWSCSRKRFHGYRASVSFETRRRRRVSG